MRKLILYAIILCMFLLKSCQGDDYVYPSVLTEFIDAQTDGSGTLTHLIGDDGTAYRIQARDGLGGLTADSLYRSVSIYEPLMENAGNENLVKLYQCQLILAPVPVFPATFKDGVKTDPADIQRIWRSGNYINMVLEVKVRDEKHTYYFIDEGIKQERNQQILNIRFYHDSKNDYEAYTHKAYLSIPLSTYQDKLKKGDKIRFFINTYKDGVIQKELEY